MNQDRCPIQEGYENLLNIIRIDDEYCIAFTIISSNGPVVKTFKADGSKDSAAQIYQGEYLKFWCKAHLIEFDKILNSLASNQTISLGLTYHDKGQLVTNNKIELGQLGQNLISRSKKYFFYFNELYGVNNNYFSIYGFDYDIHSSFTKKFYLKNPEEIKEVIREIIPKLIGIQTLIRPSSSAFIYNQETGQYRSEYNSYHIYIIVANRTTQTDKNFTEYIKRRCWQLGYAKVIKNGVGFIDKYIFDLSVASQERLFFEAIPITEYPYIKHIVNSTFIDGGILDLATINAEREEDYRPKLEEEKNSIINKGDIKRESENNKANYNLYKPTSLIKTEINNNKIFITNDGIQRVGEIYNYLKSTKKVDIKVLAKLLNNELVKAIFIFLGYLVDGNYKLKLRDENTASTSIKEDGYVKDFGSDISGNIVNIIKILYKLDFIIAFKYVQNLFGKNHNIKSKIKSLPNPKDFEKRLEKY